MTAFEKKSSEKKVEVGAAPVSIDASNPFSAWAELPEEKSRSKKEQQQLISHTGESFSLEALLGEDASEGLDTELAQKRLQQPPYPGYPPFSKIYKAAIEARKNICLSDHPRLVTQYKDTRFTSWNIAGASAVADGRSIFKETPGVLADSALRQSNKEGIIKEIVTAQQNSEQYSSIIALQEYDLNPSEQADLLKKLGPSWRIEKNSQGNVATLYDSSRFELLNEGKCSNPSDGDWKRVNLQLKDRKDNSFLTVHNAWVAHGLTADRVREDMDKFSNERPSAIANNATHDHIFLMDLNKEVLRPTQGGPMQLVPAKFRSKMVGCADTDVAVIADAKGIHILPSRTYSPVEGTAALATKEASIPYPDLSSYPREVQEELQMMRGYAVFTTEDRAIKPDGKMDLITYQHHLRKKIGSDLVELGPAGNMLGNSCFLQIRTAVTAESDRVGQARFEGFHSYVKILVSQLSSDPTVKGIECAEYQTGLNAQYVVNIKTERAMAVVNACLDDFSNLEKQLEALSKEFPDVKLKLSCTSENKLYVQFEVSEEGNSGQFKDSVMNYLNAYQWPPLSFNGNRLNMSSVQDCVANIKQVLTALKLSDSDKNNINKLKELLKEKTNDDNLKLSVICKPDGKNSASYYIKLTGSYQAGYLQYLEKKQAELGIVVYQSGIVHVPVTNIAHVMTALEAQQPKGAPAEQKQPGGKKLGNLLNEKLQAVDDSEKSSIRIEESSMQGYVDEAGAWLRCKPEEYGYFLSVLRSMSGKELAFRSKSDGLFVCISNDQLSTFLAQLPRYYPQLADASLTTIQEELRSILEDDTLSVTRKLANNECHYQLKSSSPLLAEVAKEFCSSLDLINGETLLKIYRKIESQKNELFTKEQANIMKVGWLKVKIPNSPGIKVVSSLADGGKIILILPFNAARFLAEKLGKQEGVFFKRIIIENKPYIRIYCPRDKISAFAECLGETFNRDAPVPLSGAPSLTAYVQQLCEISKGDGNIEINPFINAAGDNIEYKIRLTNAGMAEYIATKIKVENTGDQLVCPLDKLQAFNDAVKQYYEMKVFAGVPEDKSSDLNIGRYRQRLLGMGFVGVSLNWQSPNVKAEGTKVGDYKSTSSASFGGMGGDEQIAVYIPSDNFNTGFKAILEKAGEPYSVAGRIVTFPVSVMSAFDDLALQYAAIQACAKAKPAELIDVLLSSQPVSRKDSKATSSVSVVNNRDSKLVNITSKAIFSYLLQPKCSLDIAQFRSAVKEKKAKMEQIRAIVNKGIENIFKDKPEDEQLSIANIICDENSALHKLLKPKINIGKTNFIVNWKRQKQELAIKIEQSKNKLISVLSVKVEELSPKVREKLLQDDKRLANKYPKMIGESADKNLVNLRLRYLSLDKFCSEERENLTANDYLRLTREVADAGNAFSAAYAAAYKNDEKQITAALLSQPQSTGQAVISSSDKQPPPLPASRPTGRPPIEALTGSNTLAGSMQKAGNNVSQPQSSASVSGELPKKKDEADGGDPKPDNGGSGLDLNMLS